MAIQKLFYLINKKRLRVLNTLLILLFFSLQVMAQAEKKPFTRWWWMGSAVNKAGIKYNMEAFHKAGLGGVEITPIYGVKGEENKFLPFLSNEYLTMLAYTQHLADSLGMKVDMVLGTGWPYGGPQVTAQHAASKLDFQKFEIKAQQEISLNLKHKNPNVTLQKVLAYDEQQFVEDLSPLVIEENLKLNPQKNLFVYAFYNGKTGQKVKRAAPGGEGFTLDHYSKAALDAYVKPYNEKLKIPIRAVFNDSYEVYETDYTENFLTEFAKRRGYDLTLYLPMLQEKQDNEIANRIRSDYRETLSDLLKTEFNQNWTEWAHQNQYKTKLQAHGSPGNLLDLYATADVPECETFGSMPFEIPGFRRETDDIREGDADPMMLKFASSAAHIKGKPLVSSESFTWLRDHFKTALSQCKPELEELLLNGVNHVFLHGTTYSPPQAEWPGWKFYAAVNFSPQMTIWKDAPALFKYISNCQNLLQAGQADNEIALYWPIYDVWNNYLKGSLFFQFKIHSLSEWLLDTPFYQMGNELMKKGYGIDFCSDEFLQKAKVVNGQIAFEGGQYKALVIPNTTTMPLKTLEKLIELQEQGGTVIFNNKPSTVPGFKDYVLETARLQKLTQKINIRAKPLAYLEQLNIVGENIQNSGLKFIRRKNKVGYTYFIVNHTKNDFDGFLNLQKIGKTNTLYDPDTEEIGTAQINTNGLKLQLKAGKSIFYLCDTLFTAWPWPYYQQNNESVNLKASYELTFTEGGPKTPQSEKLNTLVSWTELGEDAANFSGTGTYQFQFKRPKQKADAWLLQLPEVRESAKIWLNGKYIGTLWANPFEIKLTDLKKINELKIEVTNLSANRIRAQELAGKEWKKFYEINMVNKDYKAFDASKWQPMPSGLIGEIRLSPVQYLK